MATKPQQGHGEKILDLMRSYDTMFKPKRKMWGDKYRYCNATDMSKEKGKRPTKLDYITYVFRIGGKHRSFHRRSDGGLSSTG